MKMMSKKSYCFLDIETTGLDPLKDKILEVAWVFTDENFSRMYHRNFLIDQEDQWDAVWDRINDNDFVKKMHIDSKLLADLADDDTQKYSLDSVFTTMKSDLARESTWGLVHLAGRSVHFDKSFLMENWFESLFNDQQAISFHHRMLDLTSVKLMLDSSGIDPQQFEVENTNPHRALADSFNDVLYARNIQSYLKGKSL